jgi:hypothetical protein
MRNLLLLFSLIFFPIFTFSQDTISKPQHSVISLDKVKVVYRGVENPITVSVPNAKEYWVSGPGVSKTDELGKYIIRPGSGTELKIVVSIKLQDDSIVTEEHVFQIKGFPMPIATLNGNYSTQGLLHFSLEELKAAKLDAILIDFLFKMDLIVTQFTIKVPRNNSLTVQGNIFTDEVFKLLKKAKRKDYIIISNIKGNYMGTHQTPKPITPIVFKIIK